MDGVPAVCISRSNTVPAQDSSSRGSITTTNGVSAERLSSSISYSRFQTRPNPLRLLHQPQQRAPGGAGRGLGGGGERVRGGAEGGGGDRGGDGGDFGGE